MGIDYTKRPSAPPAPDQGSSQAPSGGVNLSKLTLTKAAPAVSLSKRGGGGGMLRVNLNWNARPASAQAKPTGGFLKRLTGGGNAGGIDLDLGCLYEYSDGSKGVVQALGNALRDRNALGSEPIIWLDGDDRSGTNSGGENLFVNLAQAAAIRRVLVFAFIYEGTPNWADADAVVTLFPASGPEVEMRLDEHDPNSRMCAIALLENRGGEIVVNREIKYIQGAQDALDRAYGWGMNWSAGRK
jgi:tellurite resistance protein TerA